VLCFDKQGGGAGFLSQDSFGKKFGFCSKGTANKDKIKTLKQADKVIRKLFFQTKAEYSNWKGMAPWKVAHYSHKGWFITLFIINTAGILEILYIYIFSKRAK